MKRLIPLIVATSVQAGETECLRDILYAESRNQSVEAVAGLGQAAIVKAEKESKTLCQLKGVSRKLPPPEVRPYFEVIAKQLLKDHSTSITKGADHWNTGTKPQFPGKVTRQIENHVFYVMTAPSAEDIR